MLVASTENCWIRNVVPCVSQNAFGTMVVKLHPSTWHLPVFVILKQVLTLLVTWTDNVSISTFLWKYIRRGDRVFPMFWDGPAGPWNLSAWKASRRLVHRNPSSHALMDPRDPVASVTLSNDCRPESKMTIRFANNLHFRSLPACSVNILMGQGCQGDGDSWI